MTNIPGWAIIAAAGFGLLVSFLLFMDQNIVASLTQQPHFKLRKGLSAFLLFVRFFVECLIMTLDVFLSELCLPESIMNIESSFLYNFGCLHFE